ncbi:MAG: hypothetical protein ACRD63_05015, partial [Pyrinomonadaceae bacterium]
MYDSLSRLIRAKNPEQNVNPNLNLTDSATGNTVWSMAYDYDPNGNITLRIDPRHVVTSYGYDALSRNTVVNYSDGSHIDRLYDGAVNGRGLYWHDFKHALGSVRIEHRAIDRYDGVGRPLVQRQLFQTNGVWGATYMLQRTYDLAGHVRTQTYPSGRTVQYSYDGAGRTNGFTGNLGDGTGRNYATGISYDPWSHITKEQFGTEIPLYHNRHYSVVRGQLSDVRLGTNGGDEFSWDRGVLQMFYSSNLSWAGSGADNNGNLVMSESFLPDNTHYQQRYTYDQLNRLNGVTEYFNGANQTLTRSYAYDRYGNRNEELISTLNAPFLDPFIKDQNRLYPQMTFLTEPQGSLFWKRGQCGVPGGTSPLGCRPASIEENDVFDLKNQIASLTPTFNTYRPDAFVNEGWHGHLAHEITGGTPVPLQVLGHGHGGVPNGASQLGSRPAHEQFAPGKENASFYVHNKPTDFKLATTAQEQKQDSKQEPKQEQKKEDTKPTPTPTPSPSPTPPSSVQRLPIEIAPIEEPNPDQPCSDCGGGGGGGTPPPANRSPIGYLDGVGNGSVWGWTLDPDASAQPIHVHLYFDGPAGSGRSSTFDVGPANQSRPDVNQATGYPGDHGYSVSIPLQYRDGRSHSVYAYGIDTTGIGNVVLQSAPKFFTWFPPFNGAIYITQSVPTTMTTGQQYSVGVAMRNSGDKTWRSAESYFLGTQNPQDNFTGLIGRVSLPSDIAPGQ